MREFMRAAIVLALSCCLGAVLAQEAKLAYPATFIPRFNIPYMSKPPVIDGKIDPGEWREAAAVMGMVSTSSLNYRDRPITFWLGWDSRHLYLATRTDILPGHRLYRSKRERYAVNTVGDDAFEFGVFMHDRNKKANEVSSYLKFILNSLGSGEYMKLYPSIGQNMYNWQPDMKIQNSIYEKDGRQWWDMEVAMDLKDLQMPVENKAGDKMDILLTADLKNPGWQWLDFPSASGHLQHYGFPRTTLSKDQPYVQVEEFSGLHDEKLHLRSSIYNPSDAPVTVNAAARITQGKEALLDDTRALTIPAHGTARFDIDKAFPGFSANTSNYQFVVTRADQPDANPSYSFYCTFKGTDKSYLQATPRTTIFEYDMQYNPVSNKLLLSADTLDAQIPAGSKIAGLRYAIDKDGTVIKEGRISQYVYYKYEDMAPLPTLQPGSYRVTLTFVDTNGKTLASRNDISFQKKDEAKEFAAWWDNKLGDAEKVLKPFAALSAKSTSNGATVTCTRREYQMDGLGLPRQIIANNGKLLTRPACIIVSVAGKSYTVPAAGTLTITSAKDWRVEFTGKAAAAGIDFSVNGWMEQDGLVNLALSYAPHARPVAIDNLHVEWPVDDALGSWTSCIGGIGGNYTSRYIGKVPDGQGQVWNTLDNIGKAGSTMLVGNFESNLWVGNEYRGLLWCADSDQGWVSNDATPALSLVRGRREVAIWNNLINLPAGDKPFLLDAPRTVQLQYNASPFRNFAHGWRLTQVSAANGFSSPEYKSNEKTKQDYFSILSMPSTDANDWPYYYAKYKNRAQESARQGWYSISPRLRFFLTNQIALRGYMDKTLEPGLYKYFGADWMPGNE